MGVLPSDKTRESELHRQNRMGERASQSQRVGVAGYLGRL